MACKIVRAIASVLFLLLTIAAFIGVWNTHMTVAGWSFGTSDASLAILAAAVSLMVFHKTSKKLCPCAKSTGCGCGMSNCNCAAPTTSGAPTTPATPGM